MSVEEARIEEYGEAVAQELDRLYPSRYGERDFLDQLFVDGHLTVSANSDIHRLRDGTRTVGVCADRVMGILQFPVPCDTRKTVTRAVEAGHCFD